MTTVTTLPLSAHLRTRHTLPRTATRATLECDDEMGLIVRIYSRQVIDCGSIARSTVSDNEHVGNAARDFKGTI